MKNITVDMIDLQKRYTGYFWYSDQREPMVFQDQLIGAEHFTSLPFIIEGHLLSNDKQSITIRNWDGQYVVHAVHLDSVPMERCTKLSFLAHRMPGIEAIEICQYWEEVKDEPFTERIPFLSPSWIAFTGFKLHTIKSSS